MNLKEILDGRKTVTSDFMVQFVELFMKGMNKGNKRQFAKIVEIKFYTILSIREIPWERFIWDGTNLAYNPKETGSFNREIKGYREIILNNVK